MEQELKNKLKELSSIRNDFLKTRFLELVIVYVLSERQQPLYQNKNENIYKDVSYGFSVQMEELINKINNLVSTYVSKVENIESNYFLCKEK